MKVAAKEPRVRLEIIADESDKINNISTFK